MDRNLNLESKPGIETWNRGKESRRDAKTKLEEKLQISPWTRNRVETSGVAEVRFFGDF